MKFKEAPIKTQNSIIYPCTYSLVIEETYTEINIFINGDLKYHFEQYTVSVVSTVTGNCDNTPIEGTGGGNEPLPDAYPYWYTSGLGFNDDPYYEYYNYMNWLSGWWTGQYEDFNSSYIDPNGFYYSRIYDLQSQLLSNPFALMKCDSMNVMPLDPEYAFGIMYQRVGYPEFSTYVTDRIDSIKGLYAANDSDKIKLQNLDDASGGKVNCDFFPIRITQLPTGMNGSDLVEYFRRNMNDFLDGINMVSFEPYTHGTFSDTTKFNAPFEQSLGALVHVDIPFNDGAVIESDYLRPYYPWNPKRSRFMYSTVAIPKDGNHPVSGNREFGIYPDPSRPGEFTFYVMGVDRTTDMISTLLNSNGLGFALADQLWESMQDNMIDFINSHGGQAQKYSVPYYTARPDWENTKRFLRGEITFAELRSILGC